MGNRDSKCNCSMNNEAFKGYNNMTNKDSKRRNYMNKKDSKRYNHMNNEDSKGLIGRNALPSHYLFKIDSFSFLSKALTHKFIPDTFAAGGFKWRLYIYLNGDWNKTNRGYISVNLELIDTYSLQTGWEVDVIFNFFLFNQLKEKYFSLQDGSVKRFHAMKTKWGIKNLIDLNTFSDPLNGYLVDDTCVFGAEVFVVKNTVKGDHLSLMKNYDTLYHTWKIEKFSILHERYYDSESFGCHKWNVRLLPNGNAQGEGNSISLSLHVPRSSIPQDTKLLVKVVLCVKDQWNGKDIKLSGQCMFCPSDKPMPWGFRKFMALEKLKDPKQGFLVDDTLIIEAEVTLIGVVTKWSS